MKKNNYLIMSLVLGSFMMVFFSSCKKEDPAKAPTVQIVQATVEGFAVAFTSAATDTDTYAWDFGDGTGTSTEKDPLYTYLQSGTYTAKVTVTGAGGTAEATQDVVLAASDYEKLTGGPSAANGKSWVMSNTDEVVIYEAEDGTLQDIDETFPAGVIGLIGLGSEYADKSTFLNNGNYNQDFDNGAVTSSILFAALNGLNFTPSAEDALVLAELTEPTGATFTYNEEDLTMSVMPDPNFPAVVEEVTYTGLPYIEIADHANAFMAIIEWPRKYLVFELTNDKLVIGMFAHFPQDLEPGVDYTNFEPTHILKIALVPASN